MPDYTLVTIPVADILVDPRFNCRSEITVQSVEELAGSIVNLGRLICPVIVQPWHVLGFKYRLVVGFRRMRAITLLKWTEIPAQIVNLTDHEAYTLNLVENLERKNLNLLEEARGLRRVYPKKVTIAHAAAELKKSTEWIRARFALLRLPKAIQQQAAAGLLHATDILQLIAVIPDEQLAYAQRIVERRALPKYRKPAQASGKYKRPMAQQIRYLIRQLLKWGIEGLPTRTLAWAAGEINAEMLMEDVKIEIQKLRDADANKDDV